METAAMLVAVFFTFSTLSEGSIEYVKLVEKLACGNASLCTSAGAPYPGSVIGMPPIVAQPDCCGECSCNLDTCKVEGTCCLDTFDVLPTLEESSTRFQMTCQLPQLRPYNVKIANAFDYMRMLRLCGNSSDSEVVDKCEHPENYEDLYAHLPVLDTDSLFSYQNKHCAKCNNVPEQRLMFWKLSVQCLTDRYYETNITSIIEDVKMTVSCNLIYDPPDIIKLSPPICKEMSTTCNETGQWKRYDSAIEQACHAYTRVYKGYYKNIFCFLCNIADYSPLSRLCTSIPPPYDFPKFSALLVLPDEEEDVAMVTDTCGENQILDPFMNACIDLHCKFPKFFKDETCVDFVQSIKMVSYDIFIELRPLKDVSNNCNGNNGILGNQTYKHFFDWFTINIVPETGLHILTVSVDMDNQSNDEDTPTSVQYFLVAARISFQTVTPLSTFDKLLEIDGRTFEIGSNDSRCHCETMTSHWFQFPMTPSNRITNKTLVPVIYKTFENLKASEESVTKFNSCPHVKLTVNELDLKAEKNSYYIGKYKSIVSFDDIFVSEDSVYMCLETVEELFENNFNTVIRKKSFVIHIISLVCTMLSITFAFVTAMTYTVFREIRNQPGINNILLSLLTIAYQCMFQFGFNQAENTSTTICIILGIMAHLFWLLNLVWMNVCSFHMFRVFHGTLTKTAQFNAIKTTLCYLMYTVAVASIPVVINIIISILESNGKSIGYGGKRCYVTDSDHRKYILSVPLAVIVLTNLGLYFTVVGRLQRTDSRIKTQSRDKSFMLVYIKLSSLTGLTWTFGYVYMFTRQEWADYVFVVLNASQGVFIFVAFMLNRRTWRLYKNLFQKLRKIIKGTETAQTYMTNGDKAKNGSAN